MSSANNGSVITNDYAANITPSVNWGALNAKDYATLYAVQDPFMNSLKAGARYPISYVARIGRLRDKDGWIFPYINQYIANGQIFDDSQIDQRSVLVGGDPTAFDQTTYGFTLPSDTLRPMIGSVSKSFDTVIDASGNLNIADAFATASTSTTTTGSTTGSTTTGTTDIYATSTTATTTSTAVKQVTQLYTNTLPTNNIATVSNTTNTGLYVLIGIIGGAIIWKRSKKF